MDHTAGSRPAAGLYLESTPDERYGVLPGEDRLVRDVMVRDVATIAPDASVQEAARTMRDQGTSSLVVSEGDRLVGIVDERDIVVKGATQAVHPAAISVRELLPTGDPLACREDAILADAARLMMIHGRQTLPVLNNTGGVAGTLSLLDVAGAVMPSVAGSWLSQVRRHRPR